MSYNTFKVNDVTIEEYITGRILRVVYGDNTFKLFLQSVDKDTVVIYLGHGQITKEIKTALKEWAKSAGVNNVIWGRSRSIDKNLKL